MDQKRFYAEKIFTGHNWLEGHCIITENDIIIDIVADDTSAAPSLPAYIVPSFIDLQVYGAEGHLFSEHRNMQSLNLLCKHNAQNATAACLPTIATNSKQVIFECITVVRNYISNNGQGILGLHLEGPWINPEKRGAHLQEFIHKPGITEVEELLEFGAGIIKLITLAPEVCDQEIIKMIRSAGIRISAGHSNANYNIATKGFNNGIGMATHLFNAMSPLNHRAPGMVGAILDHPSVIASIIPDGIHVDHAAVAIAKKVLGERLFIITDAVTETSTGPYQHTLSENKYSASGVLSGSALTMPIALHNLVNYVGIELGEAVRMCSLYPARAMGIEKTYGSIAEGMPAHFVELNADLTVSKIIS